MVITLYKRYWTDVLYILYTKSSSDSSDTSGHIAVSSSQSWTMRIVLKDIEVSDEGSLFFRITAQTVSVLYNFLRSLKSEARFFLRCEASCLSSQTNLFPINPLIEWPLAREWRRTDATVLSRIVWPWPDILSYSYRMFIWWTIVNRERLESVPNAARSKCFHHIVVPLFWAMTNCGRDNVQRVNAKRKRKSKWKELDGAKRVKIQDHPLRNRRGNIAKCDSCIKNHREDCDHGLPACSRCIQRNIKNECVYSVVLNKQYMQMSSARIVQHRFNQFIGSRDHDPEEY